MTDPLDDLAGEALRLMARGVADRRCPFRTPTLSTVGLDGRPRARTVVLRGLDVPQRSIRLHSDARSAKIAELRRDPRVALVFYDAGARLQVRVEATADVHHADAVAREAWDRSQPMARAIYAVPAPGSPLSDIGAPPVPADDGAANFAVILCMFDMIDVLHLQASGHRRAIFRWEGEGRSGVWVAP